MKLTVGALIDKLSIVNIKIFMLEDVKRDTTVTDFQIAEATRKTNVLNTERNALIDAIDLGLNEISEGKKQKLYGANKNYGTTLRNDRK